MIKKGNLRGEKIKYPDGVGCCIWFPMGEGEDEGTGLCFDFSADELDDMIELLTELKEIEPEIYEEEKEEMNG